MTLETMMTWACGVNGVLFARGLWVMANGVRDECLAKRLDAEAGLLRAQAEIERLKRQPEKEPS